MKIGRRADTPTVDQRDYILDIPGVTSAAPPASPQTDAAPSTSGGKGQSQGRAWIAVNYKCCRTYARLYRNDDAPGGPAYVGHCPKCGAKTRAAIGEGGTDQRFFVAE
ncbi:MAG: hypothetical protein AAF328_11405 [Planctomycetota bacterium]